jgi:S-formylglutathione hydrolase FrmB
VPAPPEAFDAPGPTETGSFYSRARHRQVGFTIAYPPGHGPGSRLPLGIVLHAFGGTHASTLGGLTLARALAGRVRGTPVGEIALVAADGGPLYWNPHPGDDPQAMIVDELIPMCRARGLGRGPRAIGAIGISMGGYGALLLAESRSDLIAAVAAISPAVWTTYDQARAVNAGAYASAPDFASDDIVTHASALARTPVRLASGLDDPFHPGVVALSRALPRSAVVEIAAGCHDGAFFASQQYASLRFLAEHLAGE